VPPVKGRDSMRRLLKKKEGGEQMPPPSEQGNQILPWRGGGLSGYIS